MQKEYVRRKPKYSEEQKTVALEHYVNHRRCFSFTLKALGYPSRQLLTTWVRKRYPETRRCVVGNVGRPAASLASRQAAVYELCTRQGSAQALARSWTSRGDAVQLEDQLLGPHAYHRTRYIRFQRLIGLPRDSGRAESAPMTASDTIAIDDLVISNICCAEKRRSAPTRGAPAWVEHGKKKAASPTGRGFSENWRTIRPAKRILPC